MKIVNKTLGTLTALLAAGAFVQADIKPELMLSDNTLAVLTVRNIQRNFDQFPKTPLGLLLEDPAMKPFCDSLKELLNKKVLEGTSINWDNYKSIITGGIALAFTQPSVEISDEGDIENPNIIPLLIAEVTQDETKLDTFFKTVKDEVKKNGTRTIAGTEFITTAIADLKDVTDKDRTDEIWIGTKRGLLVVTYVLEPEKSASKVESEIIAVLDGLREGTILANAPSFKENPVIKPDQDYAFFNFVPLITKVKEYVKVLDSKYKTPSDPMEAAMSTPRPLAIYNALGLDALKSAALNFTYQPDGGTSAEGFVLCPKNERRGLTALMDIAISADCTPPAQIPSNLIGFKRYRLNPIKAWSLIDETTTASLGGIKMIFASMIMGNLAQNKEIDLDKNVLQNLNGDIYSLLLDISVRDNRPSTDTAYYVALKDSNALVSTILAIVKTMSPESEIATKEIAGKTVYIMNDLSPANIQFSAQENGDDEGEKPAATAASENSTYFTAIRGYLVTASNEKTMKTVLEMTSENVGAALAKDTEVTTAVEKLGGYEKSAFGYLNFKKFGETLGKMLAKDSSMRADMDDEVKALVDKLPEFNQIEKYFGFGISTSEVNEKGALGKFYVPFPEKLKK